MAKRDGNMFQAAQAKREQEQAAVTAKVTGAPKAKDKHTGGKITLSVSEQDKLTVKRYALEHGVTVSDLFHEWVSAHCVNTL